MERQEEETVSNEVNKILASSYYSNILNTAKEISGCIVKDSIPGSSGYILNLENNINAIVYVENNKVNLRISKSIYDKDISIINKFSINKDISCSQENYNMNKELKNCHNKAIKGVSIGSNSFNFCFPENLELETILFLKDGFIDFSVYWEQW